MKKIFILFFLLPLVCFGRNDFCKKVKKTYTREKGVKIITYQSPDLRHVMAIKQVRTDTIFALSVHFYDSREHFEATGASVEFEDGTVISDNNVKINCRQDISEVSGSGGGGNHSGMYQLQGFIYISSENMSTFLTKKIVKIRLDNSFQVIPPKEAVQTIDYLYCMR